MRLIDADALFAEFENVDWYNNADRDEIAERLVLQAPTIDAVSEWIPCSERLPSKKGEYLVSAIIHFIPDHVDDHSTHEGVKIAFYSMRYGWLDAENVLAWMPLPKPYGEREGER